MGIGINYSPLGAISDAARATGLSDFIREQEDRVERRRRADLELAMQAERLRQQADQDAFSRAQARANYVEGQRRFDTGLAADAYRQEQNFANQQTLLGIQGDQRNAANVADLNAAQLRASRDRSLQQDRLGAGLVEQQMQIDADNARQAAIAERQMEQAALTGDYQLRNRLMTSESPEWVTAGLREGSLKYTERQKQDMQELQESIQKARQDKRLTPAERMRFEAQQMAAYQQLRDNPVEVPVDERPLSMQDMFEQETMVFPDPVTGKEHRYQREVRNGAARWVPVEAPKDQETDLQYKEREFQLKEQQAKSAQEQRDREFDLKLRDQHNEFLNKQLMREWEQQMAVLEAEMPDKADFETPGTDSEGNATTNFDSKGYDKSLADYRGRVAALNETFRQRRMMLPLAPPNMASPLPAQPPATPEQMPREPETLPLGSADIAPIPLATEPLGMASAEPIPVADPAHLPKIGSAEEMRRSPEWIQLRSGETFEFLDENGVRVRITKP